MFVFFFFFFTHNLLEVGLWVIIFFGYFLFCGDYEEYFWMFIIGWMLIKHYCMDFIRNDCFQQIHIMLLIFFELKTWFWIDLCDLLIILFRWILELISEWMSITLGWIDATLASNAPHEYLEILEMTDGFEKQLQINFFEIKDIKWKRYKTNWIYSECFNAIWNEDNS